MFCKRRGVKVNKDNYDIQKTKNNLDDEKKLDDKPKHDVYANRLIESITFSVVLLLGIIFDFVLRDAFYDFLWISTMLYLFLMPFEIICIMKSTTYLKDKYNRCKKQNILALILSIINVHLSFIFIIIAIILGHR